MTQASVLIAVSTSSSSTVDSERFQPAVHSSLVVAVLVAPEVVVEVRSSSSSISSSSRCRLKVMSNEYALAPRILGPQDKPALGDIRCSAL